MSITYVGNCAFEETQESGRISVDPWGADTIERIYLGRKDQAETFIRNLGHRRDRNDVDFRQLFMVGYSMDVGRCFSTITVRYKGNRFGTISQPVVSSGLKLEQVTLPYLQGTDGVDPRRGAQVQIEYYAPTTTFKYYRRQRPKVANFKGELAAYQDALKIVSRTGGTGPITIATSINTTNVGAFNGILELVNTSLTCEPDGMWWNVTEENTVKIIPWDIFSNTQVAQLSNGQG